MKKENLLMCVCLMICLITTNVASAQTNEYKAQIVRILKAGAISINLESYSQSVTIITAAAVRQKHSEMTQSEKTALTTKLVNKYMQEQMFDDMASVIQGHLEKHVSYENLKNYVKVIESERCQEINRRMLIVSETTQEEIMPNIIAIAQGLEPPIIIPTECSDTYRNTFDLYYNKSGSDQLMNQLTTSISVLIQKEKNTEQINSILIPMMEYIKKNFKTAMLNGCIKEGIIEEDMRYFIENTELPAYKGIMTATQEMLSDIELFGKKIVTGFTTWLRTQMD